MKLRSLSTALLALLLAFGLPGCATGALQVAYWKQDAADGPFGSKPIYPLGGAIFDVGAVVGSVRTHDSEAGMGVLLIFDLPFSLAADLVLLPLCIYQQIERTTWEEGEFIARLDDPDAEVRATAASSLGVLEGTTHATVEALTRTLDDPDGHVRRRALGSLGELGPRSSGAVPAIVARLGDPEDGVRSAAATALGRIGAAPELALPALIAALDDPWVGVRHEAVVALERSGGDAPEVRAALERALHDEFESVREAARAALDPR